MEGQHAHTFVALIQELATALRYCETLDWIGCHDFPDQVLETIQIGMPNIDPSWSPPPPTDILSVIRPIDRLATGVYAV